MAAALTVMRYVLSDEDLNLCGLDVDVRRVLAVILLVAYKAEAKCAIVI